MMTKEELDEWYRQPSTDYFILGPARPQKKFKVPALLEKIIADSPLPIPKIPTGVVKK